MREVRRKGCERDARPDDLALADGDDAACVYEWFRQLLSAPLVEQMEVLQLRVSNRRAHTFYLSYQSFPAV